MASIQDPYLGTFQLSTMQIFAKIFKRQIKAADYFFIRDLSQAFVLCKAQNTPLHNVQDKKIVDMKQRKYTCIMYKYRKYTSKNSLFIRRKHFRLCCYHSPNIKPITCVWMMMLYRIRRYISYTSYLIRYILYILIKVIIYSQHCC